MEKKKCTYWQDYHMRLGYLEECRDYIAQGESLEELEENLRDIYTELSSEPHRCIRLNIPFLIAYIALFTLCTIALASSPTERISSRDFPSIFQAWNRADNLPDESEIATLARHDLVWQSCAWHRLSWDSEYDGNAESFTQESIDRARAFRRRIEALNPNMIFIAEIRYRDAWDGFLPADSDYWMCDADGNRVPGWAEGRYRTK